jgi:hypothetical protein
MNIMDYKDLIMDSKKYSVVGRLMNDMIGLGMTENEILRGLSEKGCKLSKVELSKFYRVVCGGTFETEIKAIRKIKGNKSSRGDKITLDRIATLAYNVRMNNPEIENRRHLKANLSEVSETYRDKPMHKVMLQYKKPYKD